MTSARAAAATSAAGGNEWCLCFGWLPQFGRSSNYDPKKRPAYTDTLYFHSFEAALHFPSRGTWWEILTPDGQVACSSHSHFNGAVIPSPSLCARQLLNDRYRGLFPESVEEGIGMGSDLVSHDDGETWESVLLGADKSPEKKPDTPRLAKPACIEILSASPSEPGHITLSHRTGRVTIKASALELRKTKTGYSLWVLDPSRMYTGGIDEGTSLVLQSLGVVVADEKRKLPKGFVRAWKPALFEIHQKERERLEVRGFTRGLLGIDRRSVERTSTYGEGEHSHSYTYTSLLWHLSHIPTGYLIASWKHRNTAQEFADLLRERMPELTDTGMEITPEVGKRVKQILDEFSA